MSNSFFKVGLKWNNRSGEFLFSYKSFKSYQDAYEDLQKELITNFQHWIDKGELEIKIFLVSEYDDKSRQ